MSESFDADEDAAFHDLADQFNRTHPSIRVIVEHPGRPGNDPTGYLENGAVTRQFVTAALAHQPVPDLVNLDGEDRVAIDTGLVVPAQDCIDTAHTDLSDFLPQALASGRQGAVQWGMPVGYDGIVGVYDATLLTRAGLDPTRLPQTIDELAADAHILAGHGVTHPLAGINLDPMLMLSGVAVSDAASGWDGRPTHATFDTPAARQIYTIADNLLADGLLQPNVPFDPYNGALATFANGTTAFTNNPLDTAMLKEQVLPALTQGQAPNVTLAVGPLPTLTGPGGTGTWPNNWYLTAGSTPQRRAAAWTFLSWLEQPAQQAIWHERTGYFPDRLAATRDPGVVALWHQEPLLAGIWKAITTKPWTRAPLVPGGAGLPDPSQIDPHTPLATVFTNAVAAANEAIDAYNADPGAAARCYTQQPGIGPTCP